MSNYRYIREEDLYEPQQIMIQLEIAYQLKRVADFLLEEKKK